MNASSPTAPRPVVALIAALAKNRAIGLENRMPWHLPEDLRHFKATTLGRPVIMGRKTWESLGRPLPGRENIVVSRNPAYQAPGAIVVASLAEALAVAVRKREEKTGEAEIKMGEEIFVIGGGALYREALPLAERMYLTEIDAEFEGDTFFPEFPPQEWREVSRTGHESATGLRFAFVLYQRTNAHRRSTDNFAASTIFTTVPI